MYDNKWIAHGRMSEENKINLLCFFLIQEGVQVILLLGRINRFKNKFSSLYYIQKGNLEK